MKFSETFASFAAAFAKAKGEIKTPKHNKKVTVQMKDKATGKPKGTYDFWYTDLAGIHDAISAPFSKNGLVAVSDVSTSKDEQGRSQVHVKTIIIHESGEFMESSEMSASAPPGIQDLGGVTTYLKRYSLSATVGLATEADDDANGAEGKDYTTEQNKSPQAADKKGGDKGANGQTTTAENRPLSDGQFKKIHAMLKEIAETQNVEVDKVYPQIQKLYNTDIAIKDLSMRSASGLITNLQKFVEGKSLY